MTTENGLSHADARNAPQVEYWNGPAGDQWAAQQAVMDGVLAPVTWLLLDAVEAQPGQRILDVGCGCGDTTLALARQVADGADGRALGVDISRPMIERARARARDEGLDSAEFALADAAAYPFESAAFDLIVSRFGVMFFIDPASALANLGRALPDGGSFTFACWQPQADNAWMRDPLASVADLFGPMDPGDPHAPGPFAFADPQRVMGLLAQAGFGHSRITPVDIRLQMPGDGDLEAAASFLLKIGPAARALGEVDEARRPALKAQAHARLVDLCGQHLQDGKVTFGAAIWLAQAKRTG